VGSPIRGLTDGFVQTGCWTRLALAGFEDLLRAAEDELLRDPAFWSGIPVVWSLPAFSAERMGWTPADAPKALNDWCLSVLGKLIQFPLGHGAENAFVCEGHVGVAAALAAAERLLSKRQALHALVIATDSWLDPMALKSLLAGTRLKTAENPIGLRPGEAGACVLVSLERVEGQRVPALALLDVTAPSAALLTVPDEGSPDGRTSITPRLGQALSEVIRNAIEISGGSVPFRGDVIVDLNGEQWRGQAWGHAQVYLQNLVDWAHCKLIVPAVSIGDVGAVSAGVALGIVTRSFVRGYATSNQALVCSISDDGKAAAFVARHPGMRGGS